MKTLFTSESVTEGHPDKVCDQIADAILDAHLADPYARVACEVTAVGNKLHIMGEVSSRIIVDYDTIAREVIRKIGYTKPEIGFDADTCEISVDIREQSPDIAMGVVKENEADSGAGDQGMMFGYACDETAEFMPYAIALSNKLAKQLAKVRKDGVLTYLRPDGKTQVTVEYDENGVPSRIETVVLSAQHDPDISEEQLYEDIRKYVIDHVLPEEMTDENTRYLINPTGRFVIGGPAGDSGLTGRKLIADTYGGYARHGGGAFSGKDPSKVDRSAAYMARYLAKNIVAAGYAKKCEIQLGYAIGIAEPVSIHVETFGTGRLTEAELIQEIQKRETLTPAGIIQKFDLRRPIYSQVSCYGHFGENAASMPWEQITWR